MAGIAAALVAAATGSVITVAHADPSTADTTTMDRTLLRNDGLYPRAIRLEHNGDANGRVLVNVNSFVDNGDGIGAVYESTDNGAGFTQVGQIASPEAADGKGMCCATLYELPQQVGDLPEGTLLWAASLGADTPDRRMSIQLWSSPDIGRNWSYLSTCAVAETDSPLWEPELSVAADGSLMCYYADETDPAHSQKLTQARSVNGIDWTDRTATVSAADPALRPGMANVRRLADGSYLMGYEICQPGQYLCAAYYRHSADGLTWGDPADLGTLVQTDTGQYFAHAPTIAIAADPNSTGGSKIFMVGQMLMNADGSVAAENGSAVFTNTNAGDGPWTRIAAPVPVADPYDNYCPNYSSSLLPSADGTSLLEIATDYEGEACKPFYDTMPL